MKGRGKRPLPEEENEDAGATEKNASRMSTKSLDKMIRLLKSMAQDGADNTFESSSDDGELSGESAAESDMENMFKVEALPLAARGWITEQDIELDRVRQLAGFLRDQPLLPPHPNDSNGLRTLDDLSLLDAGVRLPFAHCAFKNCTWHVVSGGRPPLFRGGAWRGEAPESRLRQHILPPYYS